MAPARFITLEGGEGAGKSTQAKRLATALEACGLSVCLTREPGGSSGAEQIRALLVEGAPGRWDALTETLLMFAARTDHLAQTIRPALAAGRWVVCDRFTDSTYAYQGAGRGLDDKKIAAIESAVVQSFKPDLTFILDVPVTTGLSRAGARGDHEVRFEHFDEAFHIRLREFFHVLAAREPARCILIDTTAPPDDVAAQIWQAVSTRFAV
ncbi:MAG TPA: dTMP kinase [Rhizomicrobium sp.]|jgi:dTMP kinase|nr:dTMP kinase [Rhizomicrobium sp.]